MRVLDAAPLPQRERLERLYRGEVFRDPPTPASEALAAYLRARLRDGDGLSFERLTALRRSLRRDARIPLLVRELLASLGWDLERTYVDALRLRAVPSGGHRVPGAGEAYLPHRDSWYANPPAQANLWLALADVSEEEAFGFYPGYWERPIANTSAGFDYRAWTALGGWQEHDARKHYPTVAEPIAGPCVRLAVPAAGTLLFSGTHLHATLGHDSGRTRWSAEIRTVHLDDVLAVQPRRNLDNRSAGTTLRDLRRARDQAPFPEAAAAAHEAWSAGAAASG